MRRCLNYIGGSWVMGSLVMKDFPTVKDMVYQTADRDGWMLDLDLAAPDGFNLFNDDNQVRRAVYSVCV